MPSIASHFACAKIVSNKLEIKNEEFYQGNILPDIIDLKDSHHKIKGRFYMIPDIEYFIAHNDLKKPLNIGYLCHLLLDKYFLEEFIPENVKNYQEINVFLPELMYNDYTNINYIIIKHFELDLEHLNEIMLNFNLKLDKIKYEKNISHINKKAYVTV